MAKVRQDKTEIGLRRPGNKSLQCNQQLRTLLPPFLPPFLPFSFSISFLPSLTLSFFLPFPLENLYSTYNRRFYPHLLNIIFSTFISLQVNISISAFFSFIDFFSVYIFILLSATFCISALLSFPVHL